MPAICWRQRSGLLRHGVCRVFCPCKSFRQAVLIVDVDLQIGNDPKHRFSCQPFELFQPWRQNRAVSPEFVDYKALYILPLLFIQKHHRSIKLCEHTAPVNIPCQKNRRTWQEESGYGMQVMRNSYGGFRLPGGFGQFAICLPEDDLTVSIMSADERIAPPLDAFREEIYANMQKKPLPPDPAAEKELADATERFNLAARIQAPVPSALDFPLGKEIRFLRNSFGLESLLVEQQDNGLLLHARISGENKVFRCGLKQQWQENGARFLIPADLSLRNRIYAVNPSVCRMSGAWADASSLLLLQQCPSEMSQSLVRLRWKDSLLTLELFRNDHLGRAEPSDGAATQTLKGELS